MLFKMFNLKCEAGKKSLKSCPHKGTWQEGFLVFSFDVVTPSFSEQLKKDENKSTQLKFSTSAVFFKLHN